MDDDTTLLLLVNRAKCKRGALPDEAGAGAGAGARPPAPLVAHQQLAPVRAALRRHEDAARAAPLVSSHPEAYAAHLEAALEHALRSFVQAAKPKRS